jgi:hypothetical protein
VESAATTVEPSTPVESAASTVESGDCSTMEPGVTVKSSKPVRTCNWCRRVKVSKSRCWSAEPESWMNTSNKGTRANESWTKEVRSDKSWR